MAAKRDLFLNLFPRTDATAGGAEGPRGHDRSLPAESRLGKGLGISYVCRICFGESTHISTAEQARCVSRSCPFLHSWNSAQHSPLILIQAPEGTDLNLKILEILAEPAVKNIVEQSFKTKHGEVSPDLVRYLISVANETAAAVFTSASARSEARDLSSIAGLMEIHNTGRSIIRGVVPDRV